MSKPHIPLRRRVEGVGEALVTGPVVTALDRLASLGDDVDLHAGWRELYDHDLDRGHPGASWAWDYRSGR